MAVSKLKIAHDPKGLQVDEAFSSGLTDLTSFTISRKVFPKDL